MTAPKLRLAGFKEPWSPKRLGATGRILQERTSDFARYPLYSLTIEKGVTKKTERYERGFLVSKTGDIFKIVHPGNFVTNPMNLRFGAVGYSKEKDDVSVSGYYDVFELDDNKCSPFWFNFLKREEMKKRYEDIATGSLIEKKRVHVNDLLNLELPIPELNERKSIGECLTSLDRLIDAEVLRLESLRKLKVACLEKMFVRNGERVPGLRLAGFAEDWHVTKVGDMFDYEQPQKYIVANKDYQKTGTPVLTAGKTFILGYSQEKNGVCTDVPVIIFDDFVTCSKYVNFRFKVKSSAVKILRLKDKSNSLFFVYMLMQHLGYRARYHQRHWISEYSQMSVKVPAPEEQVAISNFFMTIDQSISSVEGRIKGFRRLRRACTERMFV